MQTNLEAVRDTKAEVDRNWEEMKADPKKRWEFHFDRIRNSVMWERAQHYFGEELRFVANVEARQVVIEHKLANGVNSVVRLTGEYEYDLWKIATVTRQHLNALTGISFYA